MPIFVILFPSDKNSQRGGGNLPASGAICQESSSKGNFLYKTGKFKGLTMSLKAR